MNFLAVISPGLKVLFERVGKPEIINRPDFLRFGGTGAVIACNHVGWTDSLWMAYAVYPRELRYLSKQELFRPTLLRWVLEHGGSLPIDRGGPSPSSEADQKVDVGDAPDQPGEEAAQVDPAKVDDSGLAVCQADTSSSLK
jgi:1-acyl-sn-glycerol-3-phosphate acyltransferase